MEEKSLKKLMLAILIALAFSLVAAPTTWALEDFTGTIAAIETEEADLAITITTEDGNAVILQADPADLENLELKPGDRIQVTTEDGYITSVNKL